MITETDISYLSSHGTSWQQNFQIVTNDMYATGKRKEVIQKRSLGMLGKQWGAEALDEASLEIASEKILKELNELLDAPECPSKEMDIILAPDQLYLQVHESIGHPLELDRILGDERNYAGWSFVSQDDFGKQAVAFLELTHPLKGICNADGLLDFKFSRKFICLDDFN